jgi:predicted DNA-binding transcriptional regulator AlpA
MIAILWTTSEVLDFLRLSRSGFWNLRRRVKFPAPVALGPRSLRWNASDIQKWASSVAETVGGQQQK